LSYLSYASILIPGSVPAGIGVDFSLTTVFDKSIAPGRIVNIDSLGKYNPSGPDLLVLTTYTPAFVAGTLYFLYPVFISVSEIVFLTSSPPLKDTVIPTTS